MSIYLVTQNQELFENPLYKVIGIGESLELLNTLTIVGLDTETSSLDVHSGKLLSLQLGCRDFQIVIDTSTIDILKYKNYLESDRLFVLWNAKFDLKWLYLYHIVPHRVYDGYLAEKLMWLGYPTGMHSMSLKSAGMEYLGIELDKSVRGQIIYKGLVSETIEYAALDVKYLEDIMIKQKEYLSEKGLLTAIEYENRFVLPLAYMEYCGIRLDVEKWKEKMKKDKEREDKCKKLCDAWLLDNCPNDKIRNKYIFVDLQGDLFTGFNTEPQVRLNWSSSLQVAELLKACGVDVRIEDRERGGMKDSTDSKTLKPLKDKCSLIPIYLNYKKAVKITSTYGDNFLKQLNKYGRICTSYSQLGADTTRITSGGKDKSNRVEYVNLLNLPSDEETRACFVASDGNKFISADYSGQESVLMASIANDKAMIHELTCGDKDLHTLTAKIVFKEIPKDATSSEVKTKYHDLRQLAKGYEFAFNYMGNASTIKRNFGLSDEEANSIYNAYMNGFSGLKKYQDFARKDWWEKGYILISPLTGHKAYIYDYDELKRIEAKTKEPEFWNYYREMKASSPNCETVQMVRKFFKRKSTSDRQSGNYRIQGAGSMCLRVTLINLFEWLRRENLLFKVLLCVAPYDEVDLEAPEEIAETVAKKLEYFMEKAGSYFSKNCRLTAEVSRLKDGTLPSYWVH